MFDFLREWLSSRQCFWNAARQLGLKFLLPDGVEPWRSGDLLRFPSMAKQEASLRRFAGRVASEFEREGATFTVRDQGDRIFLGFLLAEVRGDLIVNDDSASKAASGAEGGEAIGLLALMTALKAGNPWLAADRMDDLLATLDADGLSYTSLGQLVVLLRVLGRDADAVLLVQRFRTSDATEEAGVLADAIVLGVRGLPPALRPEINSMSASAARLDSLLSDPLGAMNVLELLSHMNALTLYYAASGQFPECYASFRRNESRMYPRHWVELASFFVSEGNYVAASDVVGHARSALPHDASIVACAALIDYHMGDFDGAVRGYLDAFDGEPDRHEWLLYAAQSAGFSGDVAVMSSLLERVEVRRLSTPQAETFKLLCLEAESQHVPEGNRRAWLVEQLEDAVSWNPKWGKARENLELLRSEVGT